VSPGSSCGVDAARTSARVAKAVTTRLTGAVTCLASPSSPRQRVRIDRLSLPTGTPMPRAGHSSIATACTVS
jgi:hypothetical protein